MMQDIFCAETRRRFRKPCDENGRYIYGVVVWDKEIGLGPVGIEGRRVYTVPHRDISAVVHDCSAAPYISTDRQRVEGWVRAHQGVLDIAREKFGTVVPASFDTIIEPGGDGVSPERAVTDWLARDYERLRALVSKIEGKDEYSVQVSYEPKIIMKKVSESGAVREARKKTAAGSGGAAYQYRQKLESLIEKETRRLVAEWSGELYDRIRKHSDDIIFAKTRRPGGGRVMLLNLSCLVNRKKARGLGRELDGIDKMEGFAACITGPWPAYSFVAGPPLAGAGS
jgi:hypothetical protein